MSASLSWQPFFYLAAPVVCSKEPVTVLESSWNRVQQKAKPGEPVSHRTGTDDDPENKNFRRRRAKTCHRG